MNLDMADRAILKSWISHIVKGRRLRSEDARRISVTFETKLPHEASLEQLGIVRPVRYMADGAAFEPHWRVLKHKRPLFLSVTFEGDEIRSASRRSRLRDVEAAMWIVTINAAHAFLRDAMVKRSLELLAHLAVALVTQRRYHAD